MNEIQKTEGERMAKNKMRKSSEIGDLFDELKDEVHMWNEDWVDTVQIAYSEWAFGNENEARQSLSDLYDEAQNEHIRTIIDRIWDRAFAKSAKKSKMQKTRSIGKQSFESRVCRYIMDNYDIPRDMTFYRGQRELDFEDWVEEIIDKWNEDAQIPYDGD